MYDNKAEAPLLVVDEDEADEDVVVPAELLLATEVRLLLDPLPDLEWCKEDEREGLTGIESLRDERLESLRELTREGTADGAVVEDVVAARGRPCCA